MAISILDLIFPKRCVGCGKFGTYLCKKCSLRIELVEMPVCPACQRQAIGGKTHPKCYTRYGLDGLAAATRYRGPVKAAIRKLKYRWVTDLGETLANLLVENLWRFSLPKEVVLVPIPLHVRRKNWRGFNQAELLVKILAIKFGLSHANLLMRRVETKPQVVFNKKGRKENIKGAFVLRHFCKLSAQDKMISDIKGKDIVLVDDVFTSGATMMEAAKVLKQAGARSVFAMTVALG